MRTRLLTVTILVVMTASRPAPGRGLERPVAGPQDRPTFASEAELVVLHVTVEDRRGSYVTGLSQEAFSILENGRPQPISLFSSQDAPATVGLLIDSSGSMLPSRDLVIAAGVAFAETSHPQDEIFVLGFNEHIRAPLPPGSPFTRDASTLRAALTRAIAARGQTALYDAIGRGLDYVAQGSYERRVLVVVSDGGDNASKSTFERVLTQTQASNVVVYTVALIDPAGPNVNPGRLRQFAHASGGEAFRPRSAEQVIEVLQHIARDIRNTYTLGYMPANTPRTGALRGVRVMVSAPNQRGVVVTTRGGYLAGPPADGSPGNAR